MITTTIAPRRADLDGFARRWWTVPLGFALGLLVGAVVGALARLWMRLITEDPEFSWAGTLAIVIAFALFGGGQALSWTARRSGFRRPGSTAARIGAAVLSLLIFGGAGSIMLPTVLAGALAVWRTDWNRVARALAGLVALPTAVLVVADIVGPFGLSVRSITGVAGFLALYAARDPRAPADGRAGTRRLAHASRRPYRADHRCRRARRARRRSAAWRLTGPPHRPSPRPPIHPSTHPPGGNMSITRVLSVGTAAVIGVAVVGTALVIIGRRRRRRRKPRHGDDR